jgi:hypothetical protein
VNRIRPASPPRKEKKAINTMRFGMLSTGNADHDDKKSVHRPDADTDDDFAIVDHKLTYSNIKEEEEAVAAERNTSEEERRSVSPNPDDLSLRAKDLTDSVIEDSTLPPPSPEGGLTPQETGSLEGNLPPVRTVEVPLETAAAQAPTIQQAAQKPTMVGNVETVSDYEDDEEELEEEVTPQPDVVVTSAPSPPASQPETEEEGKVAPPPDVVVTSSPTPPAPQPQTEGTTRDPKPGEEAQDPQPDLASTPGPTTQPPQQPDATKGMVSHIKNNMTVILAFVAIILLVSYAVVWRIKSKPRTVSVAQPAPIVPVVEKQAFMAVVEEPVQKEKTFEVDSEIYKSESPSVPLIEQNDAIDSSGINVSTSVEPLLFVDEDELTTSTAQTKTKEETIKSAQTFYKEPEMKSDNKWAPYIFLSLIGFICPFLFFNAPTSNEEEDHLSAKKKTKYLELDLTKWEHLCKFQLVDSPHFSGKGRNCKSCSPASGFECGYDVSKYQKLTMDELQFLLKGFEGTTKGKSLSKGELVRAIVKHYELTLNSFNMKQLFALLLTKGIEPTGAVKKKELVKLAVEAAF